MELLGVVVDHQLVGSATGVGGLLVGVVSIALARRPRASTQPPELPPEAQGQALYESSTLARLPAEIVEQMFIAEDTPHTVEDDIAAREAAITYLEGQLVLATTAEERMPIRRMLRRLCVEIDQLRRGRESTLDRVASIFDPAWRLFYKLRPLRRRTRPWLAALLGFTFGGIGLILYLRTLVDFVVLAAIVLAAFAINYYLIPGAWWVGAGITAFYGYLRSESSNRRLALQVVPTPATPVTTGNAS